MSLFTLNEFVCVSNGFTPLSVKPVELYVSYDAKKKELYDIVSGKP